jgi:feruloyl esterase
MRLALVLPIVFGSMGMPSGCRAERAAPAPGAAPSTSAPTMTCEGLTSLQVPHVVLTDARIIAASTPPRSGPSGLDEGSFRLPAYCRIKGSSHPTADSDIRFEIAIPVGDAWNGRFEQVGNGAFAGRIPEGDMFEPLAAGYATAGTDDGHEAGPADASWAIGHPEKVIDYGYRAVKETRDAAIAVVRAYTGRAPRYSYFSGCSDGGREALTEAQRHPDDFDGIVAGAPTIPTTHVLFGFAWNFLALVESPASYIPRAKLPAIEAAALAACGDEDGVVQDPPSCRFDPSVLRCKGPDAPSCLTDAQLTALRKIYAGASDPHTGAAIEPGFEPGGEGEPAGPEPDGWAAWIVGSAPGAAGASGQYRLASAFFASMVFERPGYDLRRLDLSRDVGATDAKLASILNPENPDLGAFAKRGGKLIHYHGWLDPVLPPRDSIAYHDRVEQRMGDPRAFYRLFLAPGMLHCYGGRGPNFLDTRAAITAWVERGEAPDRLLATKYVDDTPVKPVQQTRPLCPYPERARWDGHGDRRLADSHVCVVSPDASR